MPLLNSILPNMLVLSMQEVELLCLDDVGMVGANGICTLKWDIPFGFGSIYLFDFRFHFKNGLKSWHTKVFSITHSDVGGITGFQREHMMCIHHACKVSFSLMNYVVNVQSKMGVDLILEKSKASSYLLYLICPFCLVSKYMQWLNIVSILVAYTLY